MSNSVKIDVDPLALHRILSVMRSVANNRQSGDYLDEFDESAIKETTQLLELYMVKVQNARADARPIRYDEEGLGHA